MKRFLLLFFILLIVAWPGHAQKNIRETFNDNSQLFFNFLESENRDSALKYLKLNEAIFDSKLSTDDVKYSLFYQKSAFYRFIEDYSNLIKYSKPALEYYRKKGDEKKELECAFHFTHYYYISSQYDTVIYFCNRYLEKAFKQNDQKSIAIFYLLKGESLNQKGKLKEASQVLRFALDYAKKTNNPTSIFQTLIALSNLYQEFNADYTLNYLNEARKFMPHLARESKSMLFTAYGNTYKNSGQYDSALFYYDKNLALIDTANDKTHYGSTIGNIGNVLMDMGRLDEALTKQYQSIRFFEASSDSLDIEIAYGTIADIFLKKNNYNKSLDYYKKATSMAHRLGLVEELLYNYTGLYQCYEKLGDYKKAHEAYKLYNMYNDSLRNLETTKKLTEHELTARFEAQQKEQALVQQTKDELTAEQIKRQRLIISVTLIGGIALIVVLILALRSNRIRKKINKQLEQSHKEINDQKNIIENKNREITDSITYASRLQQGILPDADDISELLPQSFFLYKPRDIVSGDFYWVRKVKGNEKIGTDLTCVVVADCTGHGVPGAFMSFIGSTILNQTLGNKKVESPADALNYLNQQLPNTLQSKVKTGQINDGMEAGICVIDWINLKLFFAGANLNLIHVSNGIVNEIKGDKHAIGLNVDQQKNFNNREINLLKGDCIYLFTDGYADQFGGEKGKKYKYKNLVNFLKENSGLSSEEQLKKLSVNFDAWKGHHEQLDDVLVFGLKV